MSEVVESSAPAVADTSSPTAGAVVAPAAASATADLTSAEAVVSAPVAAAATASSSSVASNVVGEKLHPLQHTWTMWYSKSTADWNPQPIVDFNTVEGFWRLYNNLVPAGSLPDGADYFMFKQGIKAEWEHPANANGGMWLFEFPPGSEEAVNNCWLWTLLALIGEYFTHSDDISGAVVSARPRYVRLALWTQSAGAEAVQQSIRDEWHNNFSDKEGSFFINPPKFKPHKQ